MADRVGTIVDAAIASATYNPEEPDDAGMDAKVRFEPETMARVSALYREPGTRDRVLEVLTERINEGVASARSTDAADSHWKVAFVALRMKDRLERVLGRTYSDAADGTTRMVREQPQGQDEPA